jgi:hypothetical protein
MLADLFELVGKLEQFFRGSERVTARRRESRSAPSALEETHAKVLLQLLNARRNGWLREMLVTCGGVESAQACNPVKRFYLLQGNAHDREI